MRNDLRTWAKSAGRHRLDAEWRCIPADFCAVAFIDGKKVDALVAHLRAGGAVPPPVVVQYGDSFMPLDGHHRLAAAQRLDLEMDAWVVRGRRFEDLDLRCAPDRAEDFVFCGGVPFRDVAPFLKKK
jgi:hypothetical protein